jgi:hypothetical protein
MEPRIEVLGKKKWANIEVTSFEHIPYDLEANLLSNGVIQRKKFGYLLNQKNNHFR